MRTAIYAIKIMALTELQRSVSLKKQRGQGVYGSSLAEDGSGQAPSPIAESSG
jgi:hypothetical protein